MKRVWKTVKCQGKSEKSQGVLKLRISGNPFKAWLTKVTKGTYIFFPLSERLRAGPILKLVRSSLHVDRVTSTTIGPRVLPTTQKDLPDQSNKLGLFRGKIYKNTWRQLTLFRMETHFRDIIMPTVHSQFRCCRMWPLNKVCTVFVQRGSYTSGNFI